MTIRVSVEGARGCGARKPGGLYLVSGQLSEPCPRLPMELDRCPHCGQGVGPARGWTWITPSVLFPATVHGTYEHNDRCPLGMPRNMTAPEVRLFEGSGFHRTGERAGLIWVGEKFYKTPEAFMDEAAAMGVSRRIKAVPRGFELGKDWVYLAHRKAIPVIDDQVLGEVPVNGGGGEGFAKAVVETNPETTKLAYSPGVITLFKPTAIEYVVKGDETDEEISALEERGIQPVKVVNTESDGISTWDAETGAQA